MSNRLKVIYDFVQKKLNINCNNNDSTDTDNDEDFTELIRDISKEFTIENYHHCSTYCNMVFSPINEPDVRISVGWSYLSNEPFPVLLYYDCYDLQDPSTCLDHSYEFKIALDYQKRLEKIINNQRYLDFKIERTKDTYTR